METGWILLPDTSSTLETFRKRPRRVPMVFPSPTSTRDGYGHINGVPVLHSLAIERLLTKETLGSKLFENANNFITMHTNTNE
ncbi:hypothetical protein Hanom_Chr04g00333701 [Helianthus anomalus]